MTLNEIMIAVAIISILGTLGVVTYVRVYEKSRGHQAVAILRLIRAAERVYHLDWNAYTDLPAGGCGSPLVTEGYLQCPNAAAAQERGFDYSVTSGGNSYTADATRLGTGRHAGDGIQLTVSCCPETAGWSAIGSWPSEWLP